MKNTEEIIKQKVCIAQQQIVELLSKGEVAVLIDLLMAHPKLNILDLNSYSLGVLELKSLSALLMQNNTLTTVLLAGCNIRDQGIEVLSEVFAKSKNLKCVDLECNTISFKGVKVIEQAIAQNHNLQHIKLAYNNIQIPFEREAIININNDYIIQDRRLESFFKYCFDIAQVELTNLGALYSEETLKKETFYSYKIQMCIIKQFTQEPELRKQIEESWLQHNNMSIFKFNKDQQESKEQNTEFDQVSIFTKCHCGIFATTEIKYDNPLLNNPKLLQAFKNKYGIQQLSSLISLTDELAKGSESFKHALEGATSQDEVLGKLEELIGLTSNNPDLV